MRGALVFSGVAVLAVTTAPPLAAASAPVPRSTATGFAPLAFGDWIEYRNRPPSGGFNQAETALSPATVGGLQIRGHGTTSGYSGGQVGATGHGLFLRGGPNGGIATYDEATGSRVWSAANGSNLIAVGDAAVYTVAPEGALYAYRASTGAPLWHRTIGGSIDVSPPTLAGSRVLLGVVRFVNRTEVSEVVSISATTGAVQWRTRVGSNGGQVSHVAVRDGMAVVTLGSANVYALDVATGALRWSLRTNGSGGGLSVPSPVLRDSTVFVGLVDGVFRALDLDTGRLKWSRNLGSVIFATAAEGDGIVYAATAAADTTKKDLFALDVQTGAVRWSRASGSDISSPTLANGVLYVGSLYGGSALKAYNAATGAALGGWPMTFPISEPLVSHGKVYVIADGGELFVFAL